MKLHYFAKDGNYGSAEGLVIIDTTDWTDDEWADIDFAIDANRPMIAHSLSTKDSVKPVSAEQLQLPFVLS
jgi:hypothetical protein